MEHHRARQVQEALDEGRTLILGAQIMLGLLCRGVFEPGFHSLPLVSRYAVLAALALVVIGFIVLLWPVAYHRIVDRGNDRGGFLAFTNRVMKPALPVLGASMGLTLYVATEKIIGAKAGTVVAVAGSSLGVFSWHGGSKRRGPGNDAGGRSRSSSSLDDKIKHVLTEARMVLPGAQALMGFQFVTILMDDFDRLPQSSKVVHLAALLLTSLSVALLMTPAARHRIVEQGANTEDFYRLAGRILMAAMIPLALAIAADLFVVIAKVTESETIAIAGAIGSLAISFGLWFGYTLFLRHRRARSSM